MNYNAPVKFLWGIFGKRVITDRSTELVSIIDILHSLKAELKIKEDGSDTSSESLSPITLPVKEMALVAMFERQTRVFGKIEINLEIEVLFPGLDRAKLNVPIGIKDTNNVAFVVTTWENANFLLPRIKGLSNHSCKISFKFEKHEIGKVELPIQFNLIVTEEEQ